MDMPDTGSPVRLRTIYGETIEATYLGQDARIAEQAFQFANAINGHKFTRYPRELVQVDELGRCRSTGELETDSDHEAHQVAEGDAISARFYDEQEATWYTVPSGPSLADLIATDPR